MWSSVSIFGLTFIFELSLMWMAFHHGPLFTWDGSDVIRPTIITGFMLEVLYVALHNSCKTHMLANCCVSGIMPVAVYGVCL